MTRGVFGKLEETPPDIRHALPCISLEDSRHHMNEQAEQKARLPCKNKECRSAGDLLKHLGVWVEIPFPDEGWLKMCKPSKKCTSDVGGDEPTGTPFPFCDVNETYILMGINKSLKGFVDIHPNFGQPPVRCCHDKKTGEVDLQTADKSPASLSQSLHAQFSLYVGADLRVAFLGYSGGAAQYSVLSGNTPKFYSLSDLSETPEGHFSGGMFCDDPGLGKTLSLLSVVVATRPQRHRPPFLCSVFADSDGDHIYPFPLAKRPKLLSAGEPCGKGDLSAGKLAGRRKTRHSETCAEQNCRAIRGDK